MVRLGLIDFTCIRVYIHQNMITLPKSWGNVGVRLKNTIKAIKEKNGYVITKATDLDISILLNHSNQIIFHNQLIKNHNHIIKNKLLVITDT